MCVGFSLFDSFSLRIQLSLKLIQLDRLQYKESKNTRSESNAGICANYVQCTAAH